MNFDPYWDYMMDEDDMEALMSYKEVKCKYCGEKNVKWKKINSRWKMVTLVKEKLHKCKKFYIAAVKGKL